MNNNKKFTGWDWISSILLGLCLASAALSISALIGSGYKELIHIIIPILVIDFIPTFYYIRNSAVETPKPEIIITQEERAKFIFIIVYIVGVLFSYLTGSSQNQNTELNKNRIWQLVLSALFSVILMVILFRRENNKETLNQNEEDKVNQNNFLENNLNKNMNINQTNEENIILNNQRKINLKQENEIITDNLCEEEITINQSNKIKLIPRTEETSDINNED